MGIGWESRVEGSNSLPAFVFVALVGGERWSGDDGGYVWLNYFI